MSFEAENEKRRIQKQISENVIKRAGVNNLDKVYYVGSPDIIDKYCGKPIYVQIEPQNEEPEYAEEIDYEPMNMGQNHEPSIGVYSSGSPSANYGSTPMSQSDSAAFDAIMNNNKSYSKSIEDLLNENQ